MRVLVTGATGTVGEAVVDELVQRGVRVVAAVHDLGKAHRLVRSGVELMQVELRSPRTLTDVFSNVDALFLLTPLAEDMVEMTETIVAAAQRAGVRRVVKLSAIGAEDGRTQLGQWHREAERIVEESGIPWTILRAAPFMQNFLTGAGETIREEGIIYAPAGNGKVAFVDARDIAAVAATALTAPELEERIYTVTGPDALTHAQAAAVFSKALGRTITYTNVDERQARSAMERMPARIVDALLDLGRAMRDGEFSRVTQTVQTLTAQEPRTFARFVREHADEFVQGATPAAKEERHVAAVRT